MLIDSPYMKTITIVIILPLLILLVLFMRFSSVVFGEKKKTGDVSLIRYTYFYLLFASQISVLFYAPLLYAIYANPALKTNVEAVALFTMETALTFVGIYVLAKYTPAFKFPIYFLIHVIRRTKMTISDRISYNQLFSMLVLTYFGLLIYIELVISLIKQLMVAGFKYPLVDLFLILIIIYLILRFIAATEKETKKAVAYIVNRFSKTS